MKTHIPTFKVHWIVVLLGLAIPTSLVAQTTGWLQTGAGPFDYTNAANWVEGAANGIWDSSLTLTAHQVATFSDDAFIPSLTFIYAGDYDIRLRGTAGNRTVTLGGDITTATAIAKRTINLGSVTDGEQLDIDLGGVARSFHLSSMLLVYNTIFHGDVTVDGTSALKLKGPYGNISGGDVTIKRGAFLHFDKNGESDPGTTRVGNARLEASTLRFTARSNVNATETIGDTLTLAPSLGIGGTPQIYGYRSTKNIHLHIQRVVQDGLGIVNVDFNGSTLGTTDFTSGFNITLGEGGDPIGTGTNGTTTCPVLPWARNNGRLMTYHPTLGFRVMDRATEFNTYTNGYVGSVITPGENLFVTVGTTVEFTNAVNVVNAIETGYGNAFRLIVTNGVLQVTSGAIFFDANSTSYINANIDFGSRRGYIVDRAGKAQILQGSIAGSGGLTIANSSTGNSTGSGGTGVTLASQNNTYQGDTHIHGRISANAENFFPSGDRLGDLYVHGYFQFGNAPQTINALNGAGYMWLGNGYVITLTVGDNDANGDYSGQVERSNGTLSLTKIGSGTQRFSGSCLLNGATTVDAGTLMVDGSFTNSAVTVNTDATLSGAGTIAKGTKAITLKTGATLAPGSTNGLGTMTVLQGAVAFEDGAALEVTAGKTGQSALSVADAVTGSGIIPVSVRGKGYGKWKILEAASIEPTFESATSGVILTVEAEGTQLWAERLDPVTIVVVK